MNLRRRMRAWYRSGKDDGRFGDLPNPSRVSGGDGEFYRWAYDAGYRDGQRQRQVAVERLRRIDPEFEL